jgi:outer membrane protein OmpA-like peptidoglycan-associated protein
MYRLVGIGIGAIGAGLALTVAVVDPDLLDFAFRLDPPGPVVTRTVARPSLPSAPPAAPKSIGDTKLAFDVVRIDPEGASVFAGRAPPNSNVTILANGRSVAAATVDETGAWATVTDGKIAPGQYELSLRATSKERADLLTGQTVRLVVPPPAPRTVPAATRLAAAALSMPPPITFVYNEATFTDAGRQAAALLAAQLASQRPALVSLSGHADERGSDPYNMELSRQRLQVVADYLRQKGFAGELQLVPKGKSEPYRRVDRQLLSREDALQLDRRVELRDTR